MRIATADLAIVFEDIVLTLNQPIEVFASASYSPILSLAAFIVFNYPNVVPPHFNAKVSENNSPDA